MNLSLSKGGLPTSVKNRAWQYCQMAWRGVTSKKALSRLAALSPLLLPAAMNTHSWPAMQRTTVPALTRTTRRSLSGMSPVSVRVKLTSCFLTRPARKYVPSVTDWRRHLWKTA